MSDTPRTKNDVLKFVEEGTLTPEQAESIFPEGERPPISQLLDEPKGTCNRTKRIPIQKSATLDLVEEGALSEAQAAELLGVPEDAITETLD